MVRDLVKISVNMTEAAELERVIVDARRNASERLLDFLLPTPSLHAEVAPGPGSDGPDLHERTRELINRASGFVVLGGKAGTLAELSQLWALDRAGCLKDRPVVLLGAVFRTLIDALKRNEMLDEAQRQLTPIVDTPAEAVAEIRRRLSAPAEGQR